MAGVQLNWSIFDGFLTRGKVRQARANYERATIELDDVARRIELEVRPRFRISSKRGKCWNRKRRCSSKRKKHCDWRAPVSRQAPATQLDVLSRANSPDGCAEYAN